MADTLEITGKNTISFASGQRWQLYGQARPRGMSDPLSREELEREIRKLPLEIRSHALQMGLSKITFPFNIEGSSGADMEDALHDLIETLEDGALYIATRGARGTKAQIKYKKDGASADSYKIIFYGEYDEAGARDVLGREQMGHKLIGAGLTLYCEPTWHPSSTTNLVNDVTVHNHDDADSGHDNFIDIAAANIKGDLDAPVKIRVVPLVTTPCEINYVNIFRRTRGTVTNFVSQYEGESAANTNWPSAVDTECSNGSKASKGAGATSGSLVWTKTVNLNDLRGRLQVYGRLKGVAATSKFRMRIKVGVGTGYTHTGKYKSPSDNNTFEMLDLGAVDIPPSPIPVIGQYKLYVEYDKADSDVVECDFIQLMPVDESALCIAHSDLTTQVNSDDYLELNQIDVPYEGHFDSTEKFMYSTASRGQLTLRPGLINRLLFNWVRSNNRWEINHAVSSNRVEITVDYMPQYISPLE